MPPLAHPMIQLCCVTSIGPGFFAEISPSNPPGWDCECYVVRGRIYHRIQMAHWAGYKFLLWIDTGKP